MCVCVCVCHVYVYTYLDSDLFLVSFFLLYTRNYSDICLEGKLAETSRSILVTFGIAMGF